MNKQPRLRDLFLAPILGLAYCIYLPAVGIVMTTALVGKKLFLVTNDYLTRAAYLGWRPSESYLTGKRMKDKKKKD